MDTMSEQYLETLCRTCMHEIAEVPAVDASALSEQQWQSVFDTIDECGAKRIAELITNTMPQIKVHLFDELPKKICLECLQQLLSSYRFQQMCTQSDQQMRELIAKKSTDLNTAEASVDNEISAQAFLAQEFNLEATDFESVESLPEALPQASAIDDDTSESNDEGIDHCEDSQIDLSEFLKNEQFYNDEHTAEYSADDDETLHSTPSVKNEALNDETEEKQINLASSTYNGHKNDQLQSVFCDLCGKMLSNQFALARHIRLRHANEKPKNKNVRPTCDICDMTFSRRYTLMRHKKYQHSTEKSQTSAIVKEVRCELCEKPFSSNILLARHMRVRHYTGISQNNLKIECKLCGTTYSRRSSLIRHERRQHSTGVPHMRHETSKKGKVPCDLCLNMFSSQYSVDRHKRAMHSSEGKKPPNIINKPICEICDVTFSSQSSLVRHNRFQHSNENAQETDVMIPCDQCGRTFLSYVLLARHRRIRHFIRKANQKQTCDVCGGTFINRYSLMRHCHRKHASNEFSEHKCEVCHKYFKDSNTLKVHMATHTGERQFLCRQCGATFVNEGNLKNHILHRHQKSSALKSHTCDICSASFTRSEQLRRHKMCHGERSFKCDYCELSFFRADDRRRHVRTHTGEKPYKCNYCDRAFTQSNDRVRHLRLHIGEKVYRCELCPSAFRLATELRLHCVEHKNDDNETRERNMIALKEAEAKLRLSLP